jgi:hypothetical protein
MKKTLSLIMKNRDNCSWDSYHSELKTNFVYLDEFTLGNLRMLIAYKLIVVF